MSGNVVTRTTVGLFKRNCNSYSNFTIPHPPAVGAPFRAMWALICSLSRIFMGIPFRYARVPFREFSRLRSR